MYVKFFCSFSSISIQHWYLKTARPTSGSLATGGEGDDFIATTKCMIYDPDTYNTDMYGVGHWTLIDPCTQGKGICKKDLGKPTLSRALIEPLNIIFVLNAVMTEGDQPIEDSVDYQLSSGLKAEIPEDFTGNGHIHMQLLPIASGDDKFLTIKMSGQITLSKLVFEMPDTKAFKTVEISYQRQSIQYPDDWEDLGVRLSYPGYILSINAFFVHRNSMPIMDLCHWAVQEC